MKLEQVKVQDLKPAPYNPRVIDPHVLDKLAKGIKQYGMVEPLVANKRKGRENIIIGGHQRLKAAEMLGFDKVPVYYVDLDERDEKALNLALNKLSGEWDYPMLTSLLKEFESIPDFDMELTGFDKVELVDIGNALEQAPGTLMDFYSGQGPANSSRLEPARLTIVSVGAFIQGVKKEDADDEYSAIHHELRDMAAKLQVEGSDEDKLKIAVMIAKAAHGAMSKWAKK